MMPFPSIKQDPILFWESHNDLFRHIGGGIFVTFHENIADIERNTPKGLLTLVAPEDTENTTPDGAPHHRWAREDVCCLQHSSGTTGLKKGVTLTFASIDAQIRAYTKAAQISPDDAIVSWLPLYHDMGFVTALLMPLAMGNHVATMSPFEWLSKPLYLFEMVKNYAGRYVWLPNFAFNHLANCVEGEIPIDLSNVKAFVNCSEPCRPETFDQFARAFAAWGVRHDQLQVCYAMAETVFAVSQTELGVRPKSVLRPKFALEEHHELTIEADHSAKVLSAGRPVEGFQVRIDGSVVGEIQVRGDSVFDGYYKRDSSNSFEGGWYKTGDIGFFFEDELYILGRKQDLIIVLGRNFFAHEIETLINDLPGIKAGRVVAFGVYNASVGSEDVVIVAELEGTKPKGEVRANVKRILESTIGLVPKKIEFVEAGWLVKSTSGKVSRNRNKRKYLGIL